MPTQAFDVGMHGEAMAADRLSTDGVSCCHKVCSHHLVCHFLMSLQLHLVVKGLLAGVTSMYRIISRTPIPIAEQDGHLSQHCTLVGGSKSLTTEAAR